MVWGGLLAAHGARWILPVVRWCILTPLSPGLVGAYLPGTALKEALNPITCRWSLPVLRFWYIGWFGLTRVLRVAQTREQRWPCEHHSEKDRRRDSGVHYRRVDATR